MENSLDELLGLSDSELATREVWHKFDALIETLPNPVDRVAAWEQVVAGLSGRNAPLGHPHFRLGILHLVNDPDTTAGIKHLEEAHNEDLQYGVNEEAFRKAAYRVLCLVKDFLGDLQGRKDWKVGQLFPPHRTTLIRTLLAVYDETARNILDLNTHTYSPFFKLIKNDSLRRFAGENYYLAQELLERVSFESGRSLLLLHQYPLARSIIGLYGGVLEALLLDQLPQAADKPLGRLIDEAHNASVLQLGTKLTALATLMLYFRNHIHPGKDLVRTDYFIDINVAKGIKVALDWVISDLPEIP
jgi:hypothetical protein